MIFLQSNFEKQKARKFWIGLRTMKGTHTIFCRGRLNKWKHYYFPNFQTESIWQKCWFPWYSCCVIGTIRSTSGFQQLRSDHKIMLPKITEQQIEGYFLYRMADDREASGDVKALEKGKQMFESHRIIACSFHQSGQYTFLVVLLGQL